jgi:hypothetical protein
MTRIPRPANAAEAIRPADTTPRLELLDGPLGFCAGALNEGLLVTGGLLVPKGGRLVLKIPGSIDMFADAAHAQRHSAEMIAARFMFLLLPFLFGQP